MIAAPAAGARSSGTSPGDVFAVGGWAPACGMLAPDNTVAVTTDNSAITILAVNAFYEANTGNSATVTGATVSPFISPTCP